MKVTTLGLLILLTLSCCKVKETSLDKTNSESTDFNILSETFLKNIKEGKSTTEIQDKIAKTTIEALDNALIDDAHRYAFWINIYNAYIQVVLKDQPELYDDRRNFFSSEQLRIAGQNVSFETIEHGILRKSQWSLGLGYVRKWLPGKFERKLRVDKRDYRIHFALNCGATDCPPVAIYSPERIEKQFEKGTKTYLERTSDYDPTNKTISVTSLFSWFRGDFGGKSGTKDILKTQGIIKSTDDVEIEYSDYDWTLDLDNFIDL
jgi:hypothetical protein